MDACIGALIFYVLGYGLAYGDVNGGFIGTKKFAGDFPEDGSDLRDFSFQFAFAATAATIVSGSLAERTKLESYMIFSLLMTGFIYPVIVAWTWGGGWLLEFGYIDFAGSGIVHMTGGIAGLVGAIVVGARYGKFPEDLHERISEQEVQNDAQGRPITQVDLINSIIDDIGEQTDHKDLTILRKQIERANEENLGPHNIPLVVFGVLILWTGWLLFNGGSSLGVTDSASRAAAITAVMNTFIAPGAGGIVAMLLRKRITKERTDIQYDLTALTNGILAGLVSITAGCDAVQPWAAALIGASGAIIYCVACSIMNKLKIDDPLEAF